MSNNKDHKPRSLTTSLTQEAAGGLAAGILGTVIGFPLDLVKTRMQTGVKSSGGILSTGMHIVRSEGVVSLYKGVGGPIISLSILNTVNFAAYSYFHDYFGASRGWDYRNAMAGGVCGPLASSVSTIENLLKTQMQIDNVTNKQYRNSLDCLRQITSKYGLSVVYTGHVINTVRESAFISVYFFCV